MPNFLPRHGDTHLTNRVNVTPREAGILQETEEFSLFSAFMSRIEHKDFYGKYPLDPSLDEIRLFDIKPAQTGALECGLRVVRLSECDRNSFIPLSYAWGEPVSSGSPSININGNRFEIRVNLEAALYQLRDSKEVRTYWIDAICINQSDDTEKTQQLGRIRNIYSHASTATIWIGEESAASNLTIDHFNQFHGVYAYDGRFRDDLHKNATPWKYLFTDLVAREWFRRLWVVQEVVVSRDSLIVCGSRRIPWKVFSAVLITATAFGGPEALLLGEPPAHLLYRNIMPALTMGTFRERQISGPLTRLSVWIRVFGSQLCSKREDAVLALIGLASDRDEPVLRQLGYHNTAEEIFTITTQYILSIPGDLDYLCSKLYDSDGKLNLPSWVPDYASRKTPRFAFGRETFAYGHDSFDASARYLTRRYNHQFFDILNLASRMAVYVPTFSKVGGLNLISCQGIIVDTIHAISGTSLKSSTSYVTNDIADFMPFLHDAMATLFSTGSPYLTPLSPYPTSKSSQHTGETYTSALFIAIQFGLLPNEQKRFSHENIEEIIAASPKYPWSAAVAHRLIGFRVAVTENRRYVAVVPQQTQPGDVVVVLFGCSLPLVMRRVPGISEERYTLIGASYVHGIMDGEALDGPTGTGVTPQTITMQ